MYKVIIKLLHSSKKPTKALIPSIQRWETEGVRVLIYRKLQKDLGFL